MEPRVEAKQNPFDAPIPGQSLTDTPGNAPWEHPPQMTNIHEISLFLFKRLTSPKSAEQIILMLQEGVPAEALARTILFGGFQEGKWSVDAALLIAQTVLKIIIAVAMKGGVKSFKLSLDDKTNLNFRRNLADMKNKIERTAKKIAGTEEPMELPEAEVGGLMSKLTEEI